MRWVLDAGWIWVEGWAYFVRRERWAGMVADTMIIIERMFSQDPRRLFSAWTDPEQMSCWRGSPGWHVEESASERVVGGRHRHVKVEEATGRRVTTNAVFTEFHDPDVFVARQRITGDEAINPDDVMEMRVEFLRTGRQGTLVRIVQGPYAAEVAAEHSTGWEQELDRLQAYLEGRDVREVQPR